MAPLSTVFVSVISLSLYVSASPDPTLQRSVGDSIPLTINTTGLAPLISVPLPPNPINITDIAALAGHVTGPTLDNLAYTSFKLGSETIQTSRKRADGPGRISRRPEQTTAWGLHRLGDLDNGDTTTLTMTFSENEHFRSSIKFQVLPRHDCGDHRMINWISFLGPPVDCNIMQAFQEALHPPPWINVNTWLMTKSSLASDAVQEFLIPYLPDEFDDQHIANPSGDWFLLAGTLDDVPAYPYTLSRLNQQSTNTETQDKVALGTATLLVAKIIMDLVGNEMGTNHNPMTPFDIYYTKVLMHCVNDLIGHGAETLLQGGPPRRVDLDDLKLALEQLGRGEFRSSENRARFMTTEQFRTNIEQDLECSFDSLDLP